MEEKDYEHLLNICTSGDQKGFHKSFHYHRYEPTPYKGLKQLFSQYQLQSNDRIVDFGCGKGRLPFYVHNLFGSSVAGVEMNKDFYEMAVKNRSCYLKKTKKNGNNIIFHNCLAEHYPVKQADNIFYFFNPFSIQIFMKVMNNIMYSFEKCERHLELILYYAAEEYIYYLENQTAFSLKQEIKINGLYEQNQNERFLIYEL